MCRETVPEIGGGDWKGPPADSSEVVRWSNQWMWMIGVSIEMARQ